MNNKLRKELDIAVDTLNSSRDIINNVMFEENMALSNVPVQLLNSERFSRMEERVDEMSCVIDDIDEIIDRIKEVKE